MRTRAAIAVLLALMIGLAIRLATVEPPRDAGDSDRSAEAEPRELVIAVDDAERKPSRDPAGAVEKWRGIVFGRVVDPQRFPAVGATVELRDRGLARKVETDAEGRFRFAVAPSVDGRPRELHLLAHDDAGRTAIGVAWIFSREYDAGVLVLEESTEFVVEVADGSKPVAGARVVATLRSITAFYPGPVVAAESRTDARGRCTLRLPYGEVVVHALTGERCGRVAISLPVDGAGPHRIELGPTRTVEVLVVDGESKAPVPGATLRVLSRIALVGASGWAPYVPAPDIAPTDADGRTIIRSLYDDIELDLDVEGSPNQPLSTRGSTRLKPGETSARIEVHSERGGVSPIPSGPIGELNILVQDEAEEPIAGVLIAVRSAGNVLFGRPGRTDAKGRIDFENLAARRVEVRALVDPVWGAGGMKVAEVELGSEPIPLTVTLGPEVEVVARVTIDGVPRLPARYRLQSSPQPTIEERPGAGELRCRTRVAVGTDRLSYRLQGPGFVITRFDVALGEGVRGPIYVDVPLQSAGAVQGHLIGDSKGLKPELQRWDPDAKNWVTSRSDFIEGELYGTLLHRSLPDGRYRLVDRTSGAVSDEADVRAGRTAEVTLDVTRMVAIAGRVEVPSGVFASDTRIIVNDDSRPTRHGGPPGYPVKSDGTFSFTASVAGPLRVRAIHPLLLPHPDHPEVVVRAATDDLILVLTRGGTGTISFEPADGPMGGARVLFFEGEPSAKSIHECRLDWEGTEFRFGGVPPSRYTLWFDIPGFAPHVVRDVVLREESTELGKIALTPGSTVQVRLLLRDGQTPPSFALGAIAVGDPEYKRWIWVGAGTGVVALPGLGPGKFRLVGGPTGHPIDRIVTVDGENDIEIEVDLR